MEIESPAVEPENKLTPQKEKTVEPVQQLIYLGPNIPGGSLHKYQVFIGGMPEHTKELMEECPAIQSLFVPVEGFTVTDQALSIPGTPENVLYQAVIDHFRKGGKSV